MEISSFLFELFVNLVTLSFETITFIWAFKKEKDSDNKKGEPSGTSRRLTVVSEYSFSSRIEIEIN